MEITPHLGPILKSNQPVMITHQKKAKGLIRLLAPTDMSAEGLTERILEVCHPMIEEKVPTQKKETAVTRTVVVDQGVNRNARSIHPVIVQAPDHLPIHHRRKSRKGNLFHQILLHPIDLIKQSLVRLMAVISL